MEIHNAFRIGSEILAENNCRYTTFHKGHGIEESQWQLLTQTEFWTPDQARQIRTTLAAVCEVSMTIAGMPAIPLPGQYVAAVIANCVAPVNRLVACTKAPDTFDADEASGIMGTHVVQDMSVQQLMALVIIYSSGFPEEPPAHKLPRDVGEQMKMENTKNDKDTVQRTRKVS